MVDKKDQMPMDGMPEMEMIVDTPDYKIYKTKINGLFVFYRTWFGDERGFYQELNRIDPIAEVLGRPIVIKQVSLSYNFPGVLRGLHAEPMDKIVTPLTGRVFIAIADINPDSSTFGQYEKFTLDQTDQMKPRRTLIVTNGLANSFLTLGEQNVEYLYAVSEPYLTSEGKRAVRFNDPTLNIPWPEQPKIVSPDDENKHPFLKELFPDKFK